MNGSTAEMMNTKPLVSVITIFYNAEKFIDQAIKSVFSQTYDNWELLLVDDGSSDSSSEIAKSYAESYPEKVHCLEHQDRQNKGMSTSRNLGVSKSHGDYIAFLDADDIFLPQKLERQLEILISHPEAEMVCGPTEWWYSWTGDPQDAKLDYKREISTRYNVLFKPPAFLKLLLRTKARTPATCAILARRRLFDITGGFEDSFHGMYEDQAFFFKVFSQDPCIRDQRMFGQIPSAF
jgi:glycosyltransferase involved in cell wall biosynthesis